MRKALFTICILLFGHECFASGKISLQNNFYTDSGGDVEYRPALGLGIYEKLMKKAAVNSWVGVGSQFLETQSDVNWLVAKAQLDIYHRSLIVAPGVLYKRLLESGQDTDDVITYLKVDMVLW
jgi:hypothetical protein